MTSMSYKSGLFEEASSSNSDSNPPAPGPGPGSPSALVLETVEHGFKRHYLIPSNLVRIADSLKPETFQILKHRYKHFLRSTSIIIINH